MNPMQRNFYKGFLYSVDHPAQSLIFHHVHAHAYNTCTSTPYRCVHIVFKHMHEVTGSFVRIVVHEHIEAQKFFLPRVKTQPSYSCPKLGFNTPP